MKKNFALFLVLVMVMSVLIGCGASSTKTNSDAGKTKEAASINDDAAVTEENGTLGGANKVPDEDSIPSYKEVGEEMGSDEETVEKVHIVIKELNGYTYAQETACGNIFLCVRGTDGVYVPMTHKLELNGETINMQEVFDSYIEAPDMVNESNRAGLGLFK